MDVEVIESTSGMAFLMIGDTIVRMEGVPQERVGGTPGISNPLT